MLPRLAARFLAVVLAAGLLAGGCWRGQMAAVPAGPPAAGTPTPDRPAPTPPPAPLQALPPDVVAAEEQASSAGRPSVSLELMLVPGQSPSEFRAAVQTAGGSVRFQSQQVPEYFQVELPPGAATQLLSGPGVAAMGPDREFRIQPAQFRELPAEEARTGFGLNRDAVRLDELVGETGLLGKGIVIAMIDSGVDPSHPDLQRTPSGLPKLVDWVDLSGEGTVDTSIPVRLNPGTVTLEDPAGTGVAYNVAGITSASGRGWFGVLKEAALNVDLDHNGRTIDEFPVLVVDSRVPNHYDTVYVDGAGTRDFSRVRPLGPYRLTQQYGYLGRSRSLAAETRTPFVVAAIAPDGRRVSLGFDGDGHGTHVAGIAAGWSQGGMRGMAPEAQIMSLKTIAAGTSTARWSTIVEAMDYAVSAGAQIINLSLQNLEVESAGTAGAYFTDLVRRKGVTVILAAENAGPGLSSTSAPGDPTRIITVGGYYSPEIYLRDFGYRLPREGVWFRSGTGPRADGALVPTLIAPFSAPSSIPYWKAASGYGTLQGTSMAAPHVAGAAAVLLGGALERGGRVDASVVKRALEMGARKVDGFALFEQGFGLLNLADAWLHLQRLPSQLPFTITGPANAPGLLARNELWGSANFTLNNLGAATRVNVVSNQEWAQPVRQSLNLAEGSSRSLAVRYSPPANPGVYSALLTFSSPDRYGYEVQIPNTVVVPHRLPPEGRLSIAGTGVQAGTHRREFIRVPPGTQRLGLTFRVRPGGRMRVYLFRPDGQEAARSDVLGEGPERAPSSVAFRPTEHPMPGVWEILAVSEPDLVQFTGSSASDYAVEVQAFGISAAVGPALNPGASEVLRFSYPAGGVRVREQVTIRSGLLAFTGGVVGAGFGDAQDQRESRLATRMGLTDTFTLKRAAGLVRIEAQPAQPIVAPLGLHLRKRDESTQPARFAEVGVAPESVEPRTIEQPLDPGTYHVMAVSRGGQDQQPFQYQRLVFYRDDQVRVVDPPRRRGQGDTWTVTVEMDLPATPGRHRGYLLLRDTETDQTLAWLPLEVSVGQAPVAVVPLEPELVAGREGLVTFQLMDLATGAPLDGAVNVAGMRYQVTGGWLEVPVRPAAPGRLELPVEANLPGRRPFSDRFSFVAGQRPSVVPVAPNTSPENPAGRAKVQHLLGRP